MLRTGMYLQNRYEILGKIGSGGMSVVYKAKCHKLNRLVAIKVLNDEFCSDAGFVKKFKMEAQAAAGLSHPNIVNVYDVVDEGDLHYIVMELIEGITLKSYIAKKGTLGSKEAIGIAIQVAQGIAAAHEQNIVHRDIKPQNMIISKDGKVKVADFGIAKAVSNQTINAGAIGSVHYMAPEQARGGFCDSRGDIYSLGITMYEMVTGRPPFEGDNTVSVALSHLQETITPPHVYNPEVTPSLERIILKCTQKRPGDRYAGANDLINDLRRALLYPDENFVKAAADPLAETMVIEPSDLIRIKEQSIVGEPKAHERSLQPDRQNRPRPQPDRRGNSAQPPARARPSEPKQARPAEQNRRGRQMQEDVNPQIEKLLTVAGIIAAVIIVAVLIFVFFRLGGIFNSGSGQSNSNRDNTVTENSSSLKDTEVYMPNVVDMLSDLAEENLKENYYLTMITEYEYSEEYEKDHIIRQMPEAGEVVAKWSKVHVVVSRGSNKTDLSQLLSEDITGEEAKTILEAKNFRVLITEEKSEQVEKGVLIRYSPEKAEANELITLHVSSGPEVEVIPMPQLVGKSDQEAIALLAEAGLSPGTTAEVFSNSIPAGHVATQEISADSEVETGTVINYTISKGPETETVAAESTEAETPAGAETNSSRGRYVAAINQTYDVSSLIGPGSGSTSVQLMVRLKQHVNGKDTYKTLMEPKTVTGNNLLPIAYSQIEGVYGVDSGTVEVVDVQTGSVLKSYGIAFFEVY